MADDQDLEQFDGVCRLFPLPGVVLFPNAMLQLHIFEPRYRQMMEDALNSDGLLTVVKCKTDACSSGSAAPSTEGEGRGQEPEQEREPEKRGEPEIEDVGCVGKIIRYERLPDGRYNLLLQGLNRVRLIDEPETDRLYRVARGELVADVETDEDNGERRQALLKLFREYTDQHHPQKLNCIAHLESTTSLGAITDFIAHFLKAAPPDKQALLADPIVSRRSESLTDSLNEILRPRRSNYPPQYSDN